MSALALADEAIESPASVVAAAAAGDDAAWRSLVQAFDGLFTSIARRYRLNEADTADVAQTTWMRLVENLDEISDPARIAGWLATTARRECLRLIRQHQRLVLVGDDGLEPGPSEDGPDESLLAREREQELRSSFLRLRDRDRLLLAMLVAEPRPPYEEISHRLGIPVGSIGPSRARALARLRTEMGNRGTLVLMHD